MSCGAEAVKLRKEQCARSCTYDQLPNHFNPPNNFGHQLHKYINNMSRFFFDGKANNNSERGRRIVGGGDKTLKLGTKKKPAQITVQTEERKTEIEAVFKENKWFAEITVSADVAENTNDLDFLKDNQVVSVTAPKAGRNDPCPCGSGKKFKKCCG